MRFLATLALVFIIGAIPSHKASAESSALYEQQLIEHFAQHADWVVEREISRIESDTDQRDLRAAKERFDAALEDSSLYNAHLIWVQEIMPFQRRNPAENWDGVPRLSVEQYNQLMALISAAYEGTSASEQLMSDGDRTRRAYFFREMRPNRMEYNLLLLNGLFFRGYEDLRAQYGDWFDMLDPELLAAMDPPVVAIEEALTAEAQADAAEAQADAAEAQVDAAIAAAAARADAAAARADLQDRIYRALTGN